MPSVFWSFSIPFQPHITPSYVEDIPPYPFNARNVATHDPMLILPSLHIPDMAKQHELTILTSL